MDHRLTRRSQLAGPVFFHSLWFFFEKYNLSFFFVTLLVGFGFCIEDAIFVNGREKKTTGEGLGVEERSLCGLFVGWFERSKTIKKKNETAIEDGTKKRFTSDRPVSP